MSTKKKLSDKPKFAERPTAGYTEADTRTFVQHWIEGCEAVSDDTAAAVASIGKLVDCAGELRIPEGVVEAIAACSQLLARNVDSGLRATIYYYLANAYSWRREHERVQSASTPWDNENTLQVIKNLRLAYLSDIAVPPHVQTQIRTNLGNEMSGCGRTLDAIGYWNSALDINPEFAMAHGNKGVGLLTLGQLIEDQGHAAYHAREAFRHLKIATCKQHSVLLHPNALGTFNSYKTWLAKSVPAQILVPLDHVHKRRRMTRRELEYRCWCRHHILFVNDLNDVVPEDPISEADVLSAPSIVTPIRQKMPPAFGQFSQMLQEFVSARFLYYEGITQKRPHFSDRDVTIVNEFDYAAYSLSIEKVKSAFRTAYSVLDKIAFLLNTYFELGVSERRVTFRTIWYVEQRLDRGVRPDLPEQNLPLRGLFWIAKDLSEVDVGFSEALEPDAREVSAARNHLEHKHLKLHEFDFAVPPPTEATASYSLGRADFERKTLRLLKTVRAALIHTSCSIRVEEQRRQASTSVSASPIVGLEVSKVRHEDKW